MAAEFTDRLDRHRRELLAHCYRMLGSRQDAEDARETVELVLIAAIQHLPPRQRAIFALRDVLGWSAAEVAAAMSTTTTAIHSTSQRARATLRAQLPAERSDWSSRPDVSAAERAVLDRYIAAIEAADDAAVGRLLHADVRVGHLPHAGGLVGDEPAAYARRDAVLAAWSPLLHAHPPIAIRMLPTAANRQPAVAAYTRATGARTYEAFALSVFRIEQGLITEVVTFPASAVRAQGLPEQLSDEESGLERR